MPSIKAIAANAVCEERFCAGHSLCLGCGIPTVVRTILNSIPTRVVVINATGCLEVATTRFPTTAWNVPWLHIAFENAAAGASGVETAYRALVKRGTIPDEPVTFVVFAGDGGTFDIGLQSLSGALERGHRFIYVCYDNEAYMNTGIQRSAATPFGASTTTTPVGSSSFGKRQVRKDIMAIAVAHHIPYAAQAAISHWQDLSDKAVMAARAEGPAFLNVLSSCPTGWGHESKDSIDIVRRGVESRYWPLYEVVDGHYRLNHVPEEPTPLKDWLQGQSRFRHLLKPGHAEPLDGLQEMIDLEWERLEARCAADAPWFAAHPELGSGRA